MKVLFLSVQKNKANGPNIWKNQLILQLKKNKLVVSEIYPDSLKDFFIGIFKFIKIKAIHSYSQSLGTIFYLFISKLFNKKRVHTVHGDYYVEQENKKGLKKIFWIPFNKACTILASRVTFPSKYLYNKITEKEPKIKKKSIVIPNGIDIAQIEKIKGYTKEQLGLRKSDFLIVEVTNFNLEQKTAGIDLLIKDFKKLLKDKSNTYLYIIGGGRLLNEYKNKYEGNGIKFLGFKQDAIRYIKACDLFVHYSLLENSPLVLLEAMACRKKIITLNIGGVPEILPKENILTINQLKRPNIMSNLFLKIKHCKLKEYDEKLRKVSIKIMANKYEGLYQND